MKKAFLYTLLGFFTMVTLNSCGSGEAVDTLKKGDPIPEIELYDQHKHLFSVNDFIGVNSLVIYFYPKDDTPGCTKEACTFRDSYDVFQSAGAMVIGISADSPESHLEFAEKYGLPFPLLSDSENKISKAFGVPTEFMGTVPGRVTFIVDREGIIQYVFQDLDSAEQHVEEAMQVIKQIG